MHTGNEIIAGRPPLAKKTANCKKKSKGFQCPGSKIVVDENVENTMDSSLDGGFNAKTN